MLTGDWWQPLHHYWFEVLTRAQWFGKNESVDCALADRFTSLPALVKGASPKAKMLGPRATLSAILALDQLPRNFYRGTAQAFAFDADALRLAREAVSLGIDRDLTLHERLFLYLPFEHSEKLCDQERAVDLISALGDESYTRFAVAHRAIIVRFGRFPHRNSALGRASTAEELEFLTLPESSF